MLLSFQPTVIGYACPYVWSGPGHSHPAVELEKAGELIGQLERGQHYHRNRVGISICEVCCMLHSVVFSSWCASVDRLRVTCRAPVTPQHLRSAVRPERMRNLSVDFGWACCHSTRGSSRWMCELFFFFVDFIGE